MKIFGAAAVCLILLSASALAFGTTITSVTPDKNVGVFESTEAVSFTASLSNATAEKILVIAKDINGEEVDSRTISVPNGATSVNIRFDSLSVGWYRLYICDISGNIVYNKYTAFVVTEPYSRRTVYKDSHLALDTRVGEYGGNAEKFGDAYKLMGISQTRERAYYGDSYGGRTTLGTTSSAFSALGIDTLAVWTPENRLSEYRENLNTVYSWQKLSASVLNDRINSWEIVNEPDNRSDLPADLYSAYLKAS
ncbi:MAG: hypothetical protein Q4Q25_04340, partial [Methanocorpusculum sp.]|nr:hypothetical protein [Methanocorpusculum sp.]